MKKHVFLGLVVLSILIPACTGIEGFNQANPKTIIRVDPTNRKVEIYNNKDVNLRSRGLHYERKPDGTLTVDWPELDLIDSASTVREANVNQILGFAQQALANGQAIQMVLTGVADVARSLMPFLQPIGAAKLAGSMRQMSMSLPGGVGVSSGVPPQFMEVLMQLENKANSVPVSRPAP